MAETLVLDPVEVADSRVELDLTPFVGQAGPDWGDAQIEQYMAEATRGQVPVDYRVPNRTITIPLLLRNAEGLTFEDIRSAVQAKTALFQREGGWVKRETVIGPVYADVVSATLKLGGSTLASLGFVDADAVLTLECLPDWYGDEVTLDTLTETTNPELIGVLKQDGVTAVIRGDYPARCRVVITDDAGLDQGAVTMAFRARHYDPDASAAAAYQTEALTPLGAATTAAASGASGTGSNAVTHANLATSWTPMLATQIAVSGLEMTHVGTYHVRARVRSPSGDAVAVRLVWAVGDLNDPNENPGWLIPAADRWYLADLGHIRLDRPRDGGYQWLGQIQASGIAGGEDITIDRLWLEPVDDGHLSVTMFNRLAAGSAPPSAYDTFEQTAGSLNAKAATLGGTWATSGATTDFSINTTDDVAERSTTTDTGVGRIALLGSGSLAGVLADVRVKTSAWDEYVRMGLVLRYVDANNYVMMLVAPEFVTFRRTVTVLASLELVEVVAGATTVTPLGSMDPAALTSWFRLRTVIYPNGTVNAWLAEATDAFTTEPQAATTLDSLASSGALATGRYGIADFNNGVAATRQFDDFSVAAVTTNPGAAIYADQSVELTTFGVTHATADGSAHSRPPRVTGDLPRLPPSGLEGRPVELFVKASRGDLDKLPDASIDDISATVHYRPCWLFVSDGT